MKAAEGPRKALKRGKHAKGEWKLGLAASAVWAGLDGKETGNSRGRTGGPNSQILIRDFGF